MPGLLKLTSSGATSSQDSGSDLGHEDGPIVDDYPAASFPGYSEKPLSENLEPIAVIGMGCRLPGDVDTPAKFWNMMMNKATGNTPKVPASRFNIDAHIHKNNDRPGSFGVLGGYFLNEDLANFDPSFFGITPIEALWMDPQQRKLLEVVYEALESGGITLDAISGTRTAVFAASFTADWQQMSFKDPSFRHSLSATGVDPGIISNRISHVFNLKGPSIVCNTACSSSVYALHNACNALRNKECEGAIVGGVNLIITVDQHMNTAKLGVLSPTSTCHTFDESADGYGRADAVGAVYLKRLSDAIRDGDPIRGVIRTSATNNNGKVAGVGITHPNREGQAAVISHAYKRGGDLDPRLTGYFECHGTGTAIGDPLEVHALALAMNQQRRPDDDPLLIGAVKTNIGHSEAASGLSALIKAVLIAERGTIPPTRGIVKPNPKIKWDEWKVKAVTEPVPFPKHLPVRRVSVNSFGYGGTNAHILVEAAESMVLAQDAQPYRYSPASGKQFVPRRAMHRKRPFLLPFSAHDKATLKRNIEAHGLVASKYNLLDLSYTLLTRRTKLASKAFAVASHGNLDNIFSNMSTSFTFADKKPIQTVGFIFTGQGAQWARMGAELIEQCPRFLQSIRNLDAALEELHDAPNWSIEDVLLEPAENSRIGDAEFSQPLCTAIQVALVQVLEHWGIRPTVTVGHSSGEIAAAYAAGLISAGDAIAAAYYRGKVTKDITTNGAMLAVGLGAEAVTHFTARHGGKVVIACHNSPSSVTLSGDADVIEQVRVELENAKIFARTVKTNGKAYHSHHMAPVAEKYEKLIRAAKERWTFDELPRPSSAKMVSSVTNAVLPDTTVLDHSYWSANLRNPVLFNQAVQTILASPEFSDLDLFVEIGPHSAMSGPFKQIKGALGSQSKVDYLPTLLRGKDSAVQLLSFAGEMFLRSYPMIAERVATIYTENPLARSLKPGKLSQSRPAVIVDLPRYQWNYTRPLWAETRASQEQRNPKFPRHDVLGQLVIGSSLVEPTWRNVLRISDLPWLKHHSLGGESVFPAAGYFAMAIEAITQLNETSDQPVEIVNYVLRDVSIKKALVTPDDDEGIEVTFNMRPSTFASADSKVAGTWWDFGVSSIDRDGVKKEHMAGSISINAGPRTKTPREAPQFPQRASGKAWNQALREVGFDYGPTFQDMDNVRFDGHSYQASCTTNVKQEVDPSLGESRYALHPAVVDSTLQLSIAAIYAGRTNAMDCGVVPIQVDQVTIWPPTQQQLETQKATAYAWVDRRGIRAFENSVQMTADDGAMVLEILNVRTTSYEAAVPQKAELALSEAPYGEMVWARDFDTLNTPADIQGLSEFDLLDLALFKNPAQKVLELGFRHGPSVLKKHPQVSYTMAVFSVEDKEVAEAAVATCSNAKVIHVDLQKEGGIEAQGIKTASYDIVSLSGGVKDEAHAGVLSQLSKALKADGLTTWSAPTIPAALIVMGYGDLKQTIINPAGVGMNRGIAPAKTNGAQQALNKSPEVQIVYRKYACDVSAVIKATFEALSWQVKLRKLSDCDKEVGVEHVIMLDDMDGPLLLTMTETEFEAIKTISQTTKSALWVTPGSFLQGELPDYAMTSGLVRAMTSENASVDFRTLDLEFATCPPEKIVEAIKTIVVQQVKQEGVREHEYCLSHGQLNISRLVRNKDLNTVFNPSRQTESKTIEAGDRLTGVVSKGKVVFQAQPDDEAAIAPGHVEVQVTHSTLTKEGVRVISGTDYPTTFSHELAGVVTKLGPDVTSLAVGDHVVGIHADGFSTHQKVPAALIQKLFDGEDASEVASLLMPYATALHGLQTLGRLQRGESVLILHGTGTSGAAAVKLAQAKGAVPYVVAFTEDELDFLYFDLRMPAEHILLLPEGDVSSLSERILALTAGCGVDVVFSAGSNVDPAAAREAWRSCIARFGRFVDSGRKDVLSRNVLDTLPAQRNASYLPFDLLDIITTQPDTLASLIEEVLRLYRLDLIDVPGVLENVGLAGIGQASSTFSDAFGAAKPVVQYFDGKKPTVVEVLPTRQKLKFDANATYLLVGCLGGLGRSLTSWMMKSGARRFTFLSRSGADAPSAAKLVADMEAAGAIVQIVRGDVSSEDDVKRAVAGIPAEAPIKGVVHAAMVLRDGLFHSMPFDNWTTCIEPKVKGAANLHAALGSTPLDFFIMTSSVSGVLGTPGQANYAAANSYMDSLALHRRSHGQVATSVVLPMVLGVGVVAENTALEEALKSKGMYGIDEEQLLEAFEAAIVSQTLEAIPSHVVVGLDPYRLQKAAVPDVTSFWEEDPRFSHVVHDMSSSTDSGSGSGGAQSIIATIRSAGSAAEAIELVEEHFINKLARMLMLNAEDFDANARSIADYGVDSMTGAELRNWIFKEYRIDIPFQQLLAPSLTIGKFAGQVCAAAGVAVGE
ncbi:putative polyketide synthase [Podospora aff. communis PSN243]|uniref:Polyketide synthase n=1 Tax=Podospora aff. communis PSN243 TaxID=3040156 RepID=A0AAV9H0X7_9PEZI|nr:putative polyketide synthase [Podospora aff. communis PSN243]